MRQPEHYSLHDAAGENFIANTLPEALAMVAEWVKKNPDNTILAMTVGETENWHHVTVFYE